MKLKYYQDTDTLYIELQDAGVAESKDIDENTVLDMDDAGNILAITIEHASRRTDVQHLALTGIAA